MLRRFHLMALSLCLLTACAELPPEPMPPSPGHITADNTAPADSIPEVVNETPVLPEPEPAVNVEKYTVVVNGVPVKELLFALARDAEINVDISPGISGQVTLNAVDQTMDQILDRIARQVSLRYEYHNGVLTIQADEPYIRSYRIDYLSMTRDTESTVSTDTGVGGAGGGAGGAGGAGGGAGGGSANTSTTEVSSTSNNHFWANLVSNVLAIMGEAGGTAGAGALPITANVIPHPESGILTVRATSRQHREIQEFVDSAMVNANRQVLIQATIVEVTLSDQYQAGVNWSVINQGNDAGLSFNSNTFSGQPGGTLSSFLINYSNPNSDNGERALTASLQLLEEFGEVNVLSSPQIMALNSQTAILKVVDNIVYFEVNVEPGIVNEAGAGAPAVSTSAQTVPVGIVMSLTPRINENNSIMLHVRPTISRVLEFVEDPNPELTRGGNNITNRVPQIQVREMESVLRMNDGQIAVLGGLMQERNESTDAAVPGLSRIPLLGEAFKSRTRNFEKVELVIFLRPVVINNPSLDDDLQEYRQFLKTSGLRSDGTTGSGR